MKQITVAMLMLALSACATTEMPKPAFPSDMQLVCYRGSYYLGSPAADEIVKLPLMCTEA